MFFSHICMIYIYLKIKFNKSLISKIYCNDNKIFKLLFIFIFLSSYYYHFNNSKFFHNWNQTLKNWRIMSRTKNQNTYETRSKYSYFITWSNTNNVFLKKRMSELSQVNNLTLWIENILWIYSRLKYIVDETKLIQA